jgi:hypothetical protein
LHPDFCFDLAGMLQKVKTEDSNLSLCRWLETFDDFQGSGLARTVRPKDAKNLAPGYGERNLVNRSQGAEPLDQAIYPDRCIHDNIANYITNLFRAYRGSTREHGKYEMKTMGCPQTYRSRGL